jgi:septal ring factor EnvC (AmiA/AmiB activator)
MTDEQRNKEIGDIDSEIKQCEYQKERLQWQIDDLNRDIAFLQKEKVRLLETRTFEEYVIAAQIAEEEGQEWDL